MKDANEHQGTGDGQTRLAYILGVQLAAGAVRQWPQMGESVRGRELISAVESHFPNATLEVGRRLRLGDILVVEWSLNYGDDRLYRNVTIAELANGEAVEITDYWGEPADTPKWRKQMTAPLEMPANGRWPSKEDLKRY